MAYDKMYAVITYEDDHNRTKTKRFELRTTDPAQGEIDALALVALNAPVTVAAIRKISVNGVNEYTDAPGAGANADSGVTCQVQLNGRPEKASLKWPMPVNSHFLPGGILNTSVAAIQSFVGAFEVTGGICNISDGDQVADDGLIKGVLDK